MKISCRQEKLSKALSQTIRIVPSRSELPIINNILLETEQNKLTLRSTNLKISMLVEIPAENTQTDQERIAVPATPFQSFVSVLPNDKVVMTQEKNNLKIKTASSEASFVTMSPEDFPDFPQEKELPLAVFEIKELLKLIRKTRFSAAIDESRPVLTGILLSQSNDQVSFVATDGFRLSQCQGLLKQGLLEKPLVVPATVFNEVEKVVSALDVKEVKLFLSADDNQIIFDFGNVKIASRLLDLEYPDYQRILPTEFSMKTSINKSQLDHAIRSASVFARGDSQTVYFSFDDKGLLVQAESTEVGKLEDHLDVVLEGDSLKIAFNAGFIRDFLESAEGEDILFEAKDSLSPSRWTDLEVKNYLHVIMPIRVEEDSVSDK